MSLKRADEVPNGWTIKEVPSYYTFAQVFAWLSRIGFSPAFSKETIQSRLFECSLANLRVLVRLHLLAFPFENTAMHYTCDHSMDVSPEGLYQRFILEGKGSYCFGQNTLLLGMLRGLGYRAYSGAARVNQNQEPSSVPNYTPLAHMMLFVQPSDDIGRIYLVDVGFGGSGLAAPLLLSDAPDNIIWGTAPPERHRLTRGAHPSSSIEKRDNSGTIEKLAWRLEVCHEQGNAAPWRILYIFSGEECFPEDVQMSSFGIYMRPGLFFDNVVCVKYFLLSAEDIGAVKAAGAYERDEEDGWMGRLTLFGGVVRQHAGVKIMNLKALENEADRVKMIREVFGIGIADEDVVHIKGRQAALK